ncbi:D-tyrosyl-tRNA(Tyr) deacylase [Mortierella sp. AM989]|nr:D-tyrosyl-tRNA(Tyr) deacylase [Mortierella sp. AM989]
MRAVLQRVVQASVEVNGQQISKIKQGLCVLVGLSVDDTSADIDFMVRKLLSVRVFDSNQSALQDGASSTTSLSSSSTSPSDAGEQQPSKMWAKSVVDIGGEILCVSQFTLYGQVIKGSKPDFHLSMKSETSRQMYCEFLDRLKKAYKPDRIKDGEFGAMMLVNIANDGPVTLELDSRKFEYLPVSSNSGSKANKSFPQSDKNKQQKVQTKQNNNTRNGGGEESNGAAVNMTNSEQIESKAASETETTDKVVELSLP